MIRAKNKLQISIWGRLNLVNNRRSEIEIIGKILELSSDGAKKTELLYQGNLSFSQLQKYLSFLIEKEILAENEIKNNGNSTKLYKTTDKGFLFLQDVKRVLAYF